MKNNAFVIAVALVISWSSCIAASIPRTLNYQGTLQTNTGQPVNVPTDITVSLYTTPVGTEIPFWTESMPKVPFSSGQFSVTLGATPTNPLDHAKFGGDTYIGIKVGTQSEMTPRQKMTSVAYSFNAVTAQTAAFATTATGVVPSGGIIMWSGTTVPAGWVLCDGSNGTPDLRDRFVVGVGNRFGSGKPKSVTGGEEEHVLTVNEIPAHSHKISVVNGGAAVPEWANPDSSSPQKNWPRGDTSGPNSRTTGYSNDAGGGAAHNNLPPYYALAFIMKL